MNIGQRIRIRANGGVPVRRYELSGGLCVEVYRLYPGYCVIIEQDGRRWYACAFRTWKPSRYELMGGNWYLEAIGKRMCKYKYTNGGDLAADVYVRSGWNASNYTADELLIRHNPAELPPARPSQDYGGVM